jgi:outer membrane protein
MWRSAQICVLAAVLLAPAMAGRAETSPWSARVGYGRAAFDTASVVRLAGTAVQGASVDVDDVNVLLGDLGRDLSPRFTARVTFGVPVTVAVDAAGTLTDFTPPLGGRLGEVEIAPLLGTLLYAPFDVRGWKPYVGAGLGYVMALDAKDGDVSSLEASSGWGFALQAGCDVVLSSHWSAYVDARKVYFDTEVSGFASVLGGPPVKADVTLDPLVVSAGVGYRF